MAPTLQSNLGWSRYEYASERSRDLLNLVPTKLAFDIGPGDARMRSIEQFGYVWRGFDLTVWRDIQRWDLSERCPISEKAGLVLLLDVIEHCPNPGLALRNISDALRLGGRLIITTPNTNWSASRFHFMFRGLLSGFTPRDLSENHHVFPAWPHVIEKLLNDAGMEVDEYVTLDGRTTLLSKPGNMHRALRLLLNPLLMAIESLDPAARGMSYGMIARKTT